MKKDKGEAKMYFNKEIAEEKIEQTNNSLVEKAVEMRQELTGTYFGVEELMRLFLYTPVSDYFIKDNINQCDSGSIQKVLRKVSHRKSKL